jgi:Mg-chelatase subunit ChlD
MKPDSPKNPGEELELRITALLLGELSDDEATALRQTIAQDAELSRLHDRLKFAIELARETSASPVEEEIAKPEELKLAPERRAKLLAAFAAPKTIKLVQKRRVQRRELLALAAMVIGLLAVAGLLMPAFNRASISAKMARTGYADLSIPEASDYSITVAGDVQAASERPAFSPPLTRYYAKEEPQGPESVSVNGQIETPRANQPASSTAPSKAMNAPKSTPVPANQPVASAPTVSRPSEPGAAPRRIKVVAERTSTTDLDLNTPPAQNNEGKDPKSGKMAAFGGRIALPEAETASLAQQSQGVDLFAGSQLQTANQFRWAAPSGGGGAGGGMAGAARNPAPEQANAKNMRLFDESFPLFAEEAQVSPPKKSRPFGVGTTISELSPEELEERRKMQVLTEKSPAPVDPATGLRATVEVGTLAPLPSISANQWAVSESERKRLEEYQREKLSREEVRDQRKMYLSTEKPPAPVDPATGLPVTTAGGSTVFGAGIPAPNVPPVTPPPTVDRETKAVEFVSGTQVSGTLSDYTVAPGTNGIVANYSTFADTAPPGQAAAEGFQKRLGQIVRNAASAGDIQLNYGVDQKGDFDAHGKSLDGRFKADGSGRAENDEWEKAKRETYVDANRSGSRFDSTLAGGDTNPKVRTLASSSSGRRTQIALPPTSEKAAEKPVVSTVAPIVVNEIMAHPVDALGDVQDKPTAGDGLRDLESLRLVRDRLASRIAEEKVDTAIPGSAIVEIIDPAEASQTKSPSLWGRIGNVFNSGVERSARLKVEKDAPDVEGLGAQRSTGYDPYWVQTEEEQIQSRSVLNKVAEKLNLNEAWGEKRGGERLRPEDTLALLKKKTTVSTDPKTGLIDIKVKSESADEAARIANTIAEVYRDNRSSNRRQAAQRGVDTLEKELADQEQKIAQTLQEVEQRQKADTNGPKIIQPGSIKFQDANLLEVLERYQDLTGRTVVRPATVPQTKISINTQTPLTRGETVQLLDSILAMNQITMVPQGEKFVKAVGEAQAQTQAREFNELLHANPPNSGSIVAQVIQLSNAVPRDVAQKLQPYARLPNGILSIDSAKILIVRDYAENVTRMMEELRNIGAIPPQDSATKDAALPKPAAAAGIPQPEVLAAENPFSTFSLNVSDVSFKLAAASLEKGALPEAATVRTEEFINAFDYHDPEPLGSAPIAFAWDRARYPFAHDRDLVRFSVKTAASGREPGRPLNLVLLLDNSGSMERADRLQIRQECLRVLASQLQTNDRVSVVAFARTPQLWVDGLTGAQGTELPQRVGGLTPQGGTNLEEAMNLAYRTALRHFMAEGVNRVVLLTDGAANLGDVAPESLKKKVEAHRQQGIALDCFGIGWEGYNDDLLEVLSRNGDGRYGFVNTPEAASSEFAGQLAGALKVAASDVKVQVEFNPRRVTAYRQMGYAKHQLKKEQFRDNTVDAAEIGAAEAGNALYVVQVNPRGEGPLGTVRVRFKVPGTGDYREHEWAVPYDGAAKPLEQAAFPMRLATTAAAFSEWLVTSPYAAEVAPDRLLTYLSGVPESCPADPRPKKLEWMIRQAKSVAGK